MAGLLVAIGVMGVLLSVALPVWNQAARRSREAELIFRGEQYARAVELYQRQFVGAYPPDFDTLVEQRFLRRLYEDPMTEGGRFRPVFRSQVNELSPGEDSGDRPGDATDETLESPRPIGVAFDRDGEGGVVGVVSRSQDESLRIYNGRRKYSEWVFAHVTDGTVDTRGDDSAAERGAPDDAGDPNESPGGSSPGSERTP